MFGGKIKLKPEDILFSNKVREMGKWVCVRCGRVHIPYQNTLDCSHYWGRGHQSTRFDLDNCDPLCRYPCHLGNDSTDPLKFGWEYQKQIKGYKGSEVDGDYTKYMINKLGKRKFDMLNLKAHKPLDKKINVKELRKQLRKELEAIKDGGEVLGKH